MMAGRRRSLNVLATAEAIRQAHPELQKPMRWPELSAVLAREGILVERAPIRARAYVDGGGGTFVITVRAGLNPRHHTRVIAHEYAHAKLHFPEHDEVVHQLFPCTPEDPREDEAELLSLLLRLGPNADLRVGRVARLIAKLDAPGFVRAAPEQIPLRLDRGLPVYRKRTIAKKKDLARRTAHAMWFGPSPVTGIRGVSHDALRFNWEQDGKPLGFFHLDLGWMDVYDKAFVDRDGRQRAVLVRCGDRRTSQRLFVMSSKDRRVYTFGPRELRGRSANELTRQLKAAKQLPPAKRPITLRAAKAQRK